LEKITTDLTDRDVSLLQLLGRCGVVKNDQARLAYGDVSRYHIRRIEKLAERGVIIRDNGYIRPTMKGLRAAGVTTKPVRVQKHQYEDRALAVELLASFPGWDINFGIELKRQNIVQQSSIIAGTISHNGLKYALYLISCIPRQTTIHFLLAEMRDLQYADINRVAIFCTSQDIVEALTVTPPDGLREYCVLPYPEGVFWFKQLFTKRFHVWLSNRFPGVKPCRRSFAHFEWQNAFITIMFHNDIIKRNALTSYLKHIQKREGRHSVVICASDQADEFPGSVIVFANPSKWVKEGEFYARRCDKRDCDYK